MESYLSKEEAEDRLLREYEFDAVLRPGHVRGGSRMLERHAPFSAFSLSSVTLPEDVLNWVALEAYKLSRPDEPAVSSVSVQHLGGKTYAKPLRSQAERLQEGLLEPYGPTDPLSTARVEGPAW